MALYLTYATINEIMLAATRSVGAAAHQSNLDFDMPDKQAPNLRPWVAGSGSNHSGVVPWRDRR